jgi:hypothetical protein
MLRITLISMLFATSAFAHEAGMGPNGGMRVDAAPSVSNWCPTGRKWMFMSRWVRMTASLQPRR